MQHLSQRHHPNNRQQDRDAVVPEDLFYYYMDAGQLAPAASILVTLQIEADADFKLMKMARWGYLNGATFPYNGNNLMEIAVALKDGSTGRDLTFQPVPLDSIAGSGELPAILPLYRIFKAKATIQATFSNFSSANTYDQIQLTLIGTKLFR